MTRRLLVVSRRFWPSCDERSQRLLEWGAMLRRHGIEMTVLSGRWHHTWPAESDCREIEIFRIQPSPKSTWTETLFLRNVANWILKHGSRFDVIYVDEPDAILHQVASRQVLGDRRLIARFGGLKPSSHSPLLPHGIHYAVEACRKASVVIVPNQTAHRQLHAAGGANERIVRIPDAIWKPLHRDPAIRFGIAKALRAINHDFSLPQGAKLLTYIGPIDERSGLEPVLTAVMKLLETRHDLRMWLLGEGAYLGHLYEWVKSKGYHHDILFQSPFDQLDDLLLVSDAIICPTAENGTDYLMAGALAAGVPVIAGQDSLYRSSMPPFLQDALLNDRTSLSYEKMIRDWLEHSQAWNHRAEEGRRWMVSQNITELAEQSWLKVLSGHPASP